MKSMIVAMALALVAGSGVAAASFAASEAEGGIVDAVKCAVRNALQGTAYLCHVQADAEAADANPTVERVKWLAQCVTEGHAGHCRMGADAEGAGPSPQGIVECTKQAVKETLQGTSGMCYPGRESAEGPNPKNAVDCVQGTVRAVGGAIQGHPQPYACQL